MADGSAIMDSRWKGPSTGSVDGPLTNLENKATAGNDASRACNSSLGRLGLIRWWSRLCRDMTGSMHFKICVLQNEYLPVFALDTDSRPTRTEQQGSCMRV